MKIRTLVVSSSIVLCLVFSTLTFAADDAYLYIVHGLPGRDVAASFDPTLPADVLLNDDVCGERGTTFGAVIGPLALPPGQYNLRLAQLIRWCPAAIRP
jgi:hypothetical protein